MQKMILKFIIVGFVLVSAYDMTGQVCVGTAGEVTWSYWRNLPDDSFGEMYADEYYPVKPDGSRIINSVLSPVNFDNDFGSIIRGFISVPSSESVLFNITGDDDIRFYLSSNENPTNLQMEAYINGHTGTDEHDKYPEQNSRAIALQAGQYYYFELHHIEGGGGDHVSLHWKTSFTSLNVWNFVSSQYINNIGCQSEACPERGTACNDGDITTADDEHDGFCNCVGVQTTTNSCVGERAKVEAYYYDQIPGGDLEDLYMDPNYPTMPARYERLDMLGIEHRLEADSFGTLVQGYFTVPVTGQYEFNITSNVDGIFFLSSNEDPELKQTHQILTSNSTGPTEHDKYIYQSTAPLTLEKGKYYYYEINHKESSYTEHYGLFWKTPFGVDDLWKRLPAFYLFDYNCEISCMTEGTLCDDGDRFTNNDAFDANCNCVGVPCSGPDCNDPLASYVPYPECGLTDQLDNRADASWLSCQASTSPIASYGSRHWLQYDLGAEHRIWSSHIWNYNVANATSEGFQDVAIDYSLDGVSWTNLGNYNWAQAPGDSEYSGFAGPDFGGTKVRYILITSLDQSGDCRGISKMTFASLACQSQGLPCDDGNANTYNDTFDDDCNCVGAAGSFANCTQDTLMLGDSTLMLADYSAIKLINTKSSVGAGADVSFVANESVELMPGFEGEIGAILTVEIDDCRQTQSVTSSKTVRNLKKQMEDNPLVIKRVDDSEDVIIGYHVREQGLASLKIIDMEGKVVTSLLNNEVNNPGYFTKRIRTKKLSSKNYTIELQTGGMQFEKGLEL